MLITKHSLWGVLDHCVPHRGNPSWYSRVWLFSIDCASCLLSELSLKTQAAFQYCDQISSLCMSLRSNYSLTSSSQTSTGQMREDILILLEGHLLKNTSRYLKFWNIFASHKVTEPSRKILRLRLKSVFKSEKNSLVIESNSHYQQFQFHLTSRTSPKSSVSRNPYCLVVPHARRKNPLWN